MSVMPHPSARTKNILSRTKTFCPRQNIFCPGQKNFVRDKIFWSPVKSSFLLMRIQFRSCPKFFVSDKIFLSWTKNILSRTKKFCLGQKFLKWKQGFTKYPVLLHGENIYCPGQKILSRTKILDMT